MLHHRVIQGNTDEIAHLENSLTASKSNLADTSAQLQSLKSELSEMGLENQSHKDRISNLEAQRDHLRAENNKQVDRAKFLQSALQALENELADARHRALELELLPNTLSAELATARSHISELESELDDRTEILSKIPDQYEFSGVSSDSSVFAINGSEIQSDQLPFAMHLCNLDGIILTGWIHHNNDRQLIGHVLNWNQTASALVKGEKVFMLPTKSHEIHH